MIPRGAVLDSLEGIDLGCAGRDRALGDAVGAVLQVSVQLTDAVPVEGGSSRIVLASRCRDRGFWLVQCIPVGPQAVLDRDLDGVTPISNDGGAPEGSLQREFSNVQRCGEGRR